MTALDGDPTIELALSDIVLSGNMSGLDLARALRERRPELPVLLATGYSHSAPQVVEEGFILVEKPYRRDVLAALLRSALERSRRSRDAAQPVERPSQSAAR